MSNVKLDYLDRIERYRESPEYQIIQLRQRVASLEEKVRILESELLGKEDMK